MNRLGPLIVFACAAAVGGVFVAAGALKSLDVDGFAHDIALHKILGPGLSAVLARVLVPLEIVAGAAAILGYRRRLALSVLLGLIVVFIGGTGWAWYHGNTEGCGCFGRYAARTPREVIVEDLLLAAACVVGLALSPRAAREALPAGAPATRARPSARALFIGVLAVASIVFTLASPSLPIDSLATGLRAGVTVQDLGLDRIAGNLAEGDRLLVVLVLDEEATATAIPPLNVLTTLQGIPPITGLTSATEHARAEFFWTNAPSFELLEVPAADLRRLYRRAPRAFRVHNGLVLQVWNGVPPAEEISQ